MTQQKIVSKIEPCGFFCLRSPLLPFHYYAALAGEKSLKELCNAPPEVFENEYQNSLERLLTTFEQPEVKKAILTYPKRLQEALQIKNSPTALKEKRHLNITLMRFFVRMVAKPVPLGLFAGWAVGHQSQNTNLSLSVHQDHEQIFDIAFAFLKRLSVYFEKQPELRSKLLFFTNPLLVQTKEYFSILDYRREHGGIPVPLNLVVKKIKGLQGILDSCKPGCTYETLSKQLQSIGYSELKACRFLDSLVERKFIHSELAPNPTNRELFSTLLGALKSKAPSINEVKSLSAIQEMLEKLNRVATEKEVEKNLKEFSKTASRYVDISSTELLTVNLKKSAPDLGLRRNVFHDIMASTRFLLKIAKPPGSRNEEELVHDFQKSYGEEEVDLIKVMFSTSGPDWSLSSANKTMPLLKELQYTPENEGVEGLNPAERNLLEMVLKNKKVLKLNDTHIKALQQTKQHTFPDVFDVQVSVSAKSNDAVDRGEFTYLNKGVVSIAPGFLTSRHAKYDETLKADIKSQAQRLSAEESDCIFAEVFFYFPFLEPDSGNNNILIREPSLDYVIPLYPNSEPWKENEIPLSDLTIKLSGQDLILRSKKHQKIVKPVFTSPLNVDFNPILTLLEIIQFQHVRFSCAWHWPKIISLLPYRPRVTYGRAVLARASWTVQGEQLAQMTSSDLRAVAYGFDQWRTQHDVPRWVYICLKETAEPFLLDLENILSIESVIPMMRRQNHVLFEEMFPTPENLAVKSPEGCFVSDILVSFCAPKPPTKSAKPLNLLYPGEVREIPARFPVLSEWAYLKIYCNPLIIDNILTEHCTSIITALQEAGMIDGFFFIRYADPEQHLRLRLHISNPQHQAAVYEKLSDLAERLVGEPSVFRYSFHSYEREVHRYGGGESMLLMEQFFSLNSETVLRLLSLLQHNIVSKEKLRWQFALVAMNEYLKAFLAKEEKTSFASHAALNYLSENNNDKELRISLGDLWRRYRNTCKDLLKESPEDEEIYHRCRKFVREETAKTRPLVHTIEKLSEDNRLTVSKEKLLESFLHMFCNRFFPKEQRQVELPLFWLLWRYYEAEGRKV